MRIKQGLSEISVAKSANRDVSCVSRALLGNIVSCIGDVENGLIDGLTAFYWEEHLWWAKWVTRCSDYFGAVRYYNLHGKAWSYYGSKCRKRMVEAPPILSHLPSPMTWCVRPIAYPCRFPERIPLYAMQHAKTRFVKMPPYSVRISGASQPPLSDFQMALPLSGPHRDIYQTLRPDRDCSVLHRLRLWVGGPEAKSYCANHMASAALPIPEGPNVTRIRFAMVKDHPRGRRATSRMPFSRPMWGRCQVVTN